MDDSTMRQGRTLLGAKRMAMINRVNTETSVESRNLGLGFVSHYHCNAILKDIEKERPGFTAHIRELGLEGVFTAIVGIKHDDCLVATLFVRCTDYNANLPAGEKLRNLCALHEEIGKSESFIPTPNEIRAIVDVAGELALTAYAEAANPVPDNQTILVNTKTKLVRSLADVWMPNNPLVYIETEISLTSTEEGIPPTIRTGVHVLAAVDVSGSVPTIKAPFGEGRN